MNHNKDSEQDQLKHLPINHEIYIKEEMLEKTNLHFQEIDSNRNTSVPKQTELVFVYPPTLSAEERAERKKIRNRKYQVEFRRRRKLKKEQDELLQYQQKQEILKELKKQQEQSQQIQVEFQTYDELVAEMNRERNEEQQNLNLNHEIHIKKELLNDQQQSYFETFSISELIPPTEVEQQSKEIHIKKEIIDGQQQQYYEKFTVTDLKIETEPSEIRKNNVSEYRQKDTHMKAKQIQHLQINHEIQIKEELLEHPANFNQELFQKRENEAEEISLIIGKGKN